MPIENDGLRRRRESYSYPAVALSGALGQFEICEFASTSEHDRYLNQLLSSPDEATRVLGYLAVIFWGHYSGKDQRIRPERAFGKVRLAYEGGSRTHKERPQQIQGVRTIGVDIAHRHLGDAIAAIANDNYHEALTALGKLPGIRIAFASKICAFIDPGKCGVIDSVIATSHGVFGFALDNNGYVKDTKANRQRYVAYCRWLQDKASELNADLHNSHWRDRDGASHAWRAVDVERALY